MFVSLVFDLLFFAIPTALLVFFGISLYRYLSAKSKNKRLPGTFSPEEVKYRRTALILSSVMAGILLAVVIAFVILLSMAIAYM